MNERLSYKDLHYEPWWLSYNSHHLVCGFCSLSLSLSCVCERVFANDVIVWWVGAAVSPKFCQLVRDTSSNSVLGPEFKDLIHRRNFSSLGYLTSGGGAHA